MATQLKTIQEYLNIKAGVSIGSPLLSRREAINSLAGTTNLTEQEAWNHYAGTTNATIQEAANVKVGGTIGTKLLTVQEACSLL